MRWPFWECVYPQRGDAYDCVQLYTVGQSSGRFVLEWHYLCKKLSTFVNLRYFHLWLLWFSIPNGIKDGIGGKLGMFASNEYFFPREGEKLRENVLPSSFEKNFPSFLAFWSKKPSLEVNMPSFSPSTAWLVSAFWLSKIQFWILKISLIFKSEK